LVLRRIGAFRAGELTAKQVEAFAILENELVREKNDAERQSRPSYMNSSSRSPEISPKSAVVSPA